MGWDALVAFGITEIVRRFGFWPGCIPMVSKNETCQTSFQDDHVLVAHNRILRAMYRFLWCASLRFWCSWPLLPFGQDRALLVRLHAAALPELKRRLSLRRAAGRAVSSGASPTSRRMVVATLHFGHSVTVAGAGRVASMVSSTAP